VRKQVTQFPLGRVGAMRGEGLEGGAGAESGSSHSNRYDENGQFVKLYIMLW
jgi:hypothetical protein